MLLEDFLPEYDVRERHAVVVRAPAAAVYAALWSADLAPPVTRFLVGLRGLPVMAIRALGRSRSTVRLVRSRSAAPVTMHDVVAGGFALLAEDPPREVVLGLEGAFWRLAGGVCRADAASFRAAQPRGTARAVLNLYVAQRTDGTCELSTETRVRCVDARSRRRLRFYWLVVRPGSGLIRRLALRAIRRVAEG